MIAHLEVIRDLLGTTVPVDLWTPEPGRLPPFLVIEAPSWAPDPSMAVDGVPHMIETDVRLRAVAGTPAGVGILLRQARQALGDGTPCTLIVSGRDVTLTWARAEFIGLDRDATIPDTNRHPAVGVDTYSLTSQPI